MKVGTRSMAIPCLISDFLPHFSLLIHLLHQLTLWQRPQATMCCGERSKTHGLRNLRQPHVPLRISEPNHGVPHVLLLRGRVEKCKGTQWLITSLWEFVDLSVETLSLILLLLLNFILCLCFFTELIFLFCV